MAKTNATIFLTARDMQKGRQVVEDIKKATGNHKIEIMEMDLNSLESVRNFVNKFRQRRLPINILICKYSGKNKTKTTSIHGFLFYFINFNYR